jgi:predicted unusual protein kinase regulating ubiquinone biosynthesis (AarF/ABC1/UbiB family)
MMTLSYIPLQGAMANIAQQASAAVQAAGKTGAVATSNTPTGSYEGVAALQNEFIRVYATHPVAASVAGAVALLIALAAAGSALPKQTSTPYPSGTYDAKTAAAYYRERPITVLKRAAFISLAALSIGSGILMDILTNSYKENEPKRADELTKLLTQLGPTFIKIGQSLSIRSDLLSPEYLRSLTALQDKVPAFPTETAREIISQELGRPCETVFTGIQGKPIAAASLGQVFRAKTADGRDVAVKVQRPGIMEAVSLDMFLIRTAAPLIKALGAPGDIEGLVDDWGFGFVNELDYLQEANNADAFNKGMATTPLASVVFAPPVLREVSARRVLTTAWIDGERLEKSSADDVSTLCSVAMNTYLTMMLETGTLHCDPHPGNLLRTPDGRLCILDWGLVQARILKRSSLK